MVLSNFLILNKIFILLIKLFKSKFFPDKTVEQVRSAKMSRGLKKPPVWTNYQRALLLNHGADYTQTELQKKFFPDKTRPQIASMRKHLGIRRNKKVTTNNWNFARRKRSIF